MNHKRKSQPLFEFAEGDSVRMLAGFEGLPRNYDLIHPAFPKGVVITARRRSRVVLLYNETSGEVIYEAWDPNRNGEFEDLPCQLTVAEAQRLLAVLDDPLDYQALAHELEKVRKRGTGKNIRLTAKIKPRP